MSQSGLGLQMADGRRKSALGVVVTGMHRSGTSAVATALRDGGLYAGRDQDQIPAMSQNPDGFGELVEVGRFNDRLLEQLGWAWDDIPPTAPVSPSDKPDLVAEGRDLVERLLGDGASWVLKDPRLALLLPWWRRVLLDRFVAVVTIRAPAEVAWSLAVRDGFSFELGLALWAAYYRHLATGLRGLPTIVVDYGALVSSPGQVLAKVGDGLVRMGMDAPLDVSRAAERINPALRRATQPDRPLDSTVMAAMERVAAPWSTGDVAVLQRFQLELPGPAGWETAILEAHHQVLAATSASKGSDADARRAEDVASLQSMVISLKTTADTARAEANRQRAEATSLQGEVRRLQSGLTALRTEADGLRVEAATLRGRLAEQKAELEATRRARSDARDEIRAARRELSDARVETERAWVIAVAVRTKPRRLSAIGRFMAIKVPGALRAWRVVRHNPLFDATWYLDTYRDVAGSRLGPYRHYRRHGIREGRNPNALFDTRWYLANNPDVKASGMDPLDHYLYYGAAEGRNPGPRFDQGWYLRTYPDVAAAGTNPLGHYLRQGQREGRLPHGAISPGGREARDRATSETGQSPAASDLATDKSKPERIDWSSLRRSVLSAVPTGSSIAIWTGTEDVRGQWQQYTVSRFPTGACPEAPTGSVHSATGAIANLESVRAAGTRYLAVPRAVAAQPRLWPRFTRHLARYQELTSNGTDIYELVLHSDHVRGLTDLRTLVEAIALERPEQPSVLDATRSAAASVIDLNAQVINYHGDIAAGLPYLDRTIDVVLLDRADLGHIDEARRIAAHAVVVCDQGKHGSFSTAWASGDTESHYPSVSVVIPTYHGGRMLAVALDTLAETSPQRCDIEVIVVDDGSSESAEVTAITSLRRGITLVRNERNLGFVQAANRGALAASGDVLVFLNDDVVLLPFWLEPLLRTLALNDTGAVGGRLVYPDGRLQEAGGVVFANGSAAKYGYGHPDADAPLFTYVREVDYVSGALLATLRATFLELGGFDTAYGFGYFEDVDYAFRLREAGLKTYYQPESVVVHAEGSTAGTDPAVGPKQSQVSNQSLFATRWADQLRRQPARPETLGERAWLGLAYAGQRQTQGPGT